MAFQKAALSLLLSLVILLIGCVGEMSSVAADAIEHKDPSLCEKQTAQEDRNNCYSLVAEDLNDPNICLKSKALEDCVSSYALKSGRISACDVLSDPVARYACVAKVTGDQTGRSIDSLIGEWRANGTIAKCVQNCGEPYSGLLTACEDLRSEETDPCVDKVNMDLYDCEDSCKRGS